MEIKSFILSEKKQAGAHASLPWRVLDLSGNRQRDR
jgi:hypothetical protein